MSRIHLLSLFLAAVILAGGVGAPSAARSADAPAQPSTPPPADRSRLFRFHATAQALALRDAVDQASFDDALREELRSLVREQLKRADQEAAKPPAGESLDELLDRAAALAHEFNDKRIADWLDAHPAAYQPVQEQIALAEAYARATAEEPDAVVRAARAAGLPQDREAVLKRLAADAHDRVAKANEADARRLREAQEKAGVPAAPREPLPEARPDARPQPGRGDPAPRPPEPPPLTPEQQRVQLLDALTMVDAHERLAAAARDVRAEAEKMLPEPPQRKALAEEMLRWYQALAPTDDGAREGEAKPAPGARQPRPASPGQQPGPADPGF
jgi:hypothetical protein